MFGWLKGMVVSKKAKTLMFHVFKKGKLSWSIG